MVLDFAGVISNPREIISDIPREYRDAELKVNTNTASNSTNTVYTVPAGKKFALMSMILDVNYTAGTEGNAGYAIVAGGYAIRLYGAAAAGTKMQSLATQNTLILTAGQTIRIQTMSANVFAALAISGYEMSAGN